MPPYGDSDDEESDDEDAYDLREVSSDAIMDVEDELDSDAESVIIRSPLRSL